VAFPHLYSAPDFSILIVCEWSLCSSRLIFPAGGGMIFTLTWPEKYYLTTNNDDGLKRIVFLLMAYPLEIDGQGSDFFFHGYVVPS